MMKHPVTIQGKTIPGLARELANLRYDALAEFLLHLSKSLRFDSSKDSIRGRTRLASELRWAATHLQHTSETMDNIWSFCKPYMKEDLKSKPEVVSDYKIVKPIEIGKHEGIGDPKVPKGWSTWVENGIWYKARTVSSRRYGGHDYMTKNSVRIGECCCGCYMGDSSSSGSVDPFGPCPLNPK